MTRIAIYPGSFDPPTKGHEDLIRRSLALADKVIVAVAINVAKEPLFAVEERLGMLRAAVNDPRVSFESFEGLLADFARRMGASMVVRGLRAVSDFEYEFQMALMNRQLHPALETVFLVPALDLTYLIEKQVHIIGSLGYDAAELGQGLALMADGKVDRKKLITHRFPVDRIVEAFETQGAGQAIKVMVHPTKAA